jgi:hypothetical protein
MCKHFFALAQNFLQTHTAHLFTCLLATVMFIAQSAAQHKQKMHNFIALFVSSAQLYYVKILRRVPPSPLAYFCGCV